MASTVYNGAIRGTGSNVNQTLYTNSTGGNVRIIWNFLEASGTGNDNSRVLFYGPTPSLTNGNLSYGLGNDLDVIKFTIKKATVTGRDLAYYVQGTYTWHKMINSQSHFPLEMMLANTHKLTVWTDGNINSDDWAIAYNFVVIPEGG